MIPCILRANALALAVTVFLVFPPSVSAQSGHAAHDAAAALVLSAEGECTVTVRGASHALSVGEELDAGSLVRVANGTAALVFLAGDMIELHAGQSCSLGADAAATSILEGETRRGVVADDAVTVAPSGVTRADDEDRLSLLAQMTGIRGTGGVLPVSPRLTVAENPPVFYWFDTDSAAGRTREYRLSLRDASGKEILHADVDGVVGALSAYTPAATAIERTPETRYVWSVEPKGAGSAPPVEASFTFVDRQSLALADGERRLLEGLRRDRKIDEAAFHSAAALYCLDERERLFADAVPHLVALMDTRSGRDFARRTLAGVCLRFSGQLAPVAAALAR